VFQKTLGKYYFSQLIIYNKTFRKKIRKLIINKNNIEKLLYIHIIYNNDFPNPKIPRITIEKRKE